MNAFIHRETLREELDMRVQKMKGLQRLEGRSRRDLLTMRLQDVKLADRIPLMNTNRSIQVETMDTVAYR